MAKKQAAAPRQMSRTIDHSKPKRKPVHSSRPSQSLRAALAEVEPKDLADLVEEMKRDYQVSLSLRSIVAIIKSAQVSITIEDGDNLDPLSKDRAEKLSQRLQDLFESRWSIMLECISYGRAAFEKVWGEDGRGGYYLKDLDYLPFRNTDMLLTTDAHECGAGQFAGIRLKVNDDIVNLPPEKSWWLALDPDSLNPYGKSRLMGPVHKVWQHRKCQFSREDTFEQKILFNGAVAHVPDDPIIEENQTIDPRAALDEALENLSAGGTLQLSNERDDKGNFLWDVNLPAGMSDANPIINLIAMSDVWMLRAFGIPEKTIIEGAEVGSYAMVSVQMLVVRAMCDEIFDQVKASFQEFGLDKVTEVNPWLGSARLVIKSPKLAQIPDSILIELVKSWLTSPQLSPLVASGAVNILAMIESLGISVSDSAKEQIEGMLAKLQAVPVAAPPPAPPGGTFANPQTPGEGNDLLAGLPTLDELIDSANAEASALWDELIDVLARLHQTGGHESPAKAEAILNRLKELEADTRTAGRILGMVSVWKPELSSAPKGARGIQKALPSQPVTMSLAGINSDFGGQNQIVRYPFLQDALKWLEEKKLAKASEVTQMAALDKTAVFTAPATESIPTLQALRAEVASSLSVGESFQTFRNRIADQFDLTRSQQETVYRTNTKQAYNAGMEKTLDDPDVSESFGYVMYASTTDNRTRSSHWMLDGFVCSRKDPAYAVLQRAVNDWNCRCSLIPLNKRQAEQRGVKTYADLPVEVLAKYG